MDYLIRKVLTETEYAAQAATLGPYDGVVVVSDSDPTVVVKLAIGSVEFPPAGSGSAPQDATYLTSTDESADLPNSQNVGNTNLTVGSKSILMNNTVEYGIANIEALGLTDNNSGFMWVDNSGNLSQTRTLDFETTEGKQDLTINNIDVCTFDANAYSFNGNTVASDTAFYAPIIYGGTFSNIVGSNITFTPFSQPSLSVTFDSDTSITAQGAVSFTGLTATTGTTLILDGSNQVRLLTSSARFKENIESFEINTELFNNYKKLRPVAFDYKTENPEEKKSLKTYGLIAEEVQELFPSAVNLDKEGLPFSISYDQIGVVTVSVVQNLLKEVDLLKERLTQLEKVCKLS